MNWIYAAIATVLFGGGVYVGRLTVETKVEKTEIKQDQAQTQQEAKQLATNNQADAIHDAEIKTPPPLIIKQPVWLRQPTLCVSVPAPAAGQPTPERPTDTGPAIDLRPQLAAFAIKYENALSDCRRMAAEWPQPKGNP